jgi:hypothetical protein
MQVNRVVSPIAPVQQHSDLYLFASPGLSLSERLVFGLMADAMWFGSNDVRWHCDEGRHFVGSSFNWLLSADGQTDRTLFERVVPLKSGGENSIRHEVCVMAFAEHVALVGPHVDVIKGSAAAFGDDWLADVVAQSGASCGVAFILA